MYLISLLSCVLLLCSKVSSDNPQNTGENRTRLLRFLATIAGYYTSDDPINVPEKKIILPVETSAFSPSLTFYMEDDEGFPIPTRQILVLRERPDGYIGVMFYNFTGSDDLNGPIDVSLFQRLQLSDYSTLPNCEITIAEIEDIYMMNWPECDDINNDLLPTYLATWTCDLTSYISYKNPQPDITKSKPVYIFKRKRFPLLPSMLEGVEDFKDPCDD
nr:hypothetical protein BgiMline_017849 [Biomphalaria glabrata]